MEARQFPRVPLDSMAFLRSDRDSAEGALLNLSRTGAQLSAAFRVQPRDSLSLSLSLPFQMPSLEVILAAVRWVKGKNFRVEFIQIAEGEQRQLRDFLTTHPLPTHRHERPTPKTRHHVHRRSYDLHHVGGCRDCGSVGTEGLTHRARPLQHYERVSVRINRRHCGGYTAFLCPRAALCIPDRHVINCRNVSVSTLRNSTPT